MKKKTDLVIDLGRRDRNHHHLQQDIDETKRVDDSERKDRGKFSSEESIPLPYIPSDRQCPHNISHNKFV